MIYTANNIFISCLLLFYLRNRLKCPYITVMNSCGQWWVDIPKKPYWEYDFPQAPTETAALAKAIKFLKEQGEL